MANIIITGSNGFIGKALACKLLKSHNILALTTNPKNCIFDSISYQDFFGNKVQKINDFQPTHFIHCAGIAHKRNKLTKNQQAFIKEVNTNLPLRLAKFSIDLRLKRFIFLSSIGVYGEKKMIRDNTSLDPDNFYSYTKSEAEKELKLLFCGSICELTIIRPSVVYGRECPGNFKLLKKAIDINLPIPLKNYTNQRSILYLGNLISAVNEAAFHPNAANKSFNLSDKELISTEQIIRLISYARRRKKPFLLKLPNFLYKFLIKLPIISKLLKKLSEDFVVDSSLLRFNLNWEQPFNQKNALIDSFSIKN